MAFYKIKEGYEDTVIGSVIFGNPFRGKLKQLKQKQLQELYENKGFNELIEKTNGDAPEKPAKQDKKQPPIAPEG